MSDTTARVRVLAEPLATAAGLDLVAVEVKGSGSRTLLRVVVDRKGGVDLGACQTLSRDLSARLDAEDPVTGRYTLEVTSPGVDHPLTDQRAFDRVEGRAVLVHRSTPGAPDRPGEPGEAGAQAPDRIEQIRGTVVAAEAEAVVLDVDGELMRVAYADIAKATQTLPW